MNIEKIYPLESEPIIKLSTKILPIGENDFDFDYESSHEILKMKSDEERHMVKKTFEWAREVGENRKRFWNMLVTEIPKTNYQPPQDRQTQILDVGCGDCEEGIVLGAYFGGGVYGEYSKNVKLIGIDIKKEVIDRAITRSEQIDFSEEILKWVLPPNLEFIHGDATKLDEYPQIPNQVDVIVFRHQQISDSEKVWVKIFQESLNRLSPDGIMILTSYSDGEHQMLMEKLKELDVEIIEDKRNIYAKQIEQYKEISIDRNITIVKRKSKND